MRTLLLSAFSLIWSQTALSQGAPASAPDGDYVRLPKAKTISLRPSATDSIYPEGLARKGIQGKTELLVKLAPDGTPTSVSIESSSRSPELDQAAKELALDLKFGIKGSTGQKVELVVPIEFARDSISTLPAKKCSDFNADYAYFKATFPELLVREMRVINMTVGSVVLLGVKGVPGDKLALAKRTEVAAAAIVEACASNPEANYLKTFTNLVAEGGG